MTPATAPAALPPFGLTGWPAERLADPYPVYRRYRAAARVHRAEPDGTAPTFYVLGHDEVAKVLSAPVYGRSPRRATGGAPPATVPDGHSALRSMVENWLVFLDPPRHTELRSLLNREFTPVSSPICAAGSRTSPSASSPNSPPRPPAPGPWTSSNGSARPSRSW